MLLIYKIINYGYLVGSVKLFRMAMGSGPHLK